MIIEGAGGVMTPIDNAHTNLDLIVLLGHPVILVTGTYLGAISHTLTALFVLHATGMRRGGNRHLRERGQRRPRRNGRCPEALGPRRDSVVCSA